MRSLGGPQSESETRNPEWGVSVYRYWIAHVLTLTNFLTLALQGVPTHVAAHAPHQGGLIVHRIAPKGMFCLLSVPGTPIRKTLGKRGFLVNPWGPRRVLLEWTLKILSKVLSTAPKGFPGESSYMSPCLCLYWRLHC